MTVTTVTCDRCGTVIKDERDIPEVVRYGSGDVLACRLEDIDLCYNCETELLKWWEYN